MAFCAAHLRASNDFQKPKVESSKTLGCDDVFNNGFRYFYRLCLTDEYDFSFGSGFYLACIHVDENFIGDLIGPIG